MRTRIIFYSIPLLALLGYCIVSFQPTTGPHGGVFKSAENYNIEVKKTYPSIYAYLLDNKNKPIKNKGITCGIRFLLEGDANIEVQLKPYKEDGFILESGSMGYNSFRITFNVYGKSVSAVFENESAIVQKNNPLKK